MNPLAAYQDRTGMTQEALADLLKMNQSAVSRLSNDLRSPRLSTILKIERATGITASQWAEWAARKERVGEATRS